MASAILIGFWIFASIAIFLPGFVYLAEPKLPQFLKDLLLYGKARGKRKERTFIQSLEIPKRWFIHFYIAGFLVNGFALYTVLCAYLLGQKPPEWHKSTLKYVISSRTVNTDAMSAVIVIGMMFFQNFRRLMECLFVSVYSKGTMNWLHYALGIILYSTFHLAALSEAPNYTTFRVSRLSEEAFQWRHIIGVSLFLWASYHHNRVHEQFANLRKGKDGQVVTTEHKIPTGGWFELVSCPHYFMEILIYLGFVIVTGPQHLCMWSIVLFVVTNQIVAAKISHKWYKETFKNYPRERTAIIPYLI